MSDASAWKRLRSHDADNSRWDPGTEPMDNQVTSLVEVRGVDPRTFRALRLERRQLRRLVAGFRPQATAYQVGVVHEPRIRIGARRECPTVLLDGHDRTPFWRD